MKVLISGASGAIASGLLPALAAEGHELTRLQRGTPAAGEIGWHPLRPLEPAQISGFGAVIHLAGENVFGRWTQPKKRAIYESRVQGTGNLCQALARAARQPQVLLAASGIGYYGAEHGDEWLSEESPAGADFLGRLCRDWEAATQPAANAGIRVVNLRFGLVLDRGRGMLRKMLPAFRLGLGGAVGAGTQWLSWIAMEDAAGAILHCLQNTTLAGAVNLTTPNPVRNAEFARVLARALHRPAVFRMPGFAAKLLLGAEMAAETVLASQRVLPQRLQAGGYSFRAPEIEPLLTEVLD